MADASTAQLLLSLSVRGWQHSSARSLSHATIDDMSGRESGLAAQQDLITDCNTAGQELPISKRFPDLRKSRIQKMLTSPPSNGCRSSTRHQSVVPNAQTSHFADRETTTSCRRSADMSSGAMKPGVPWPSSGRRAATPPSRDACTASPKSPNLQDRFEADGAAATWTNRQFEGFTSPCTMPFPCKCCSPCEISCMYRTNVPSTCENEPCRSLTRRISTSNERSANS